MKMIYILSLIMIVYTAATAKSDVNIDMYQDRSDPKKTIVIIEKDGIMETLTVNNTDLNDKFIEKIVDKYGKK